MSAQNTLEVTSEQIKNPNNETTEYLSERNLKKMLAKYAEEVILEGENQEEVKRVVKYFSSEYTQDDGSLITPLQRIMDVYSFLEIPEDRDKAKEFHEAIATQSQELMIRAFDQHLDNPQQYVSHGFDHSINVADYTRAVYEQNPQIIAAMKDNYGVTESEAKFLLESVALFHDAGYPDLRGRAKAVHGISGADIISTETMKTLFQILVRTPDVAHQKLIINDMRNAILFHSSDKVEQNFGVKIDTTRGTFLTNKPSVTGVISLFDKKGEVTNTVNVEVSDVSSILEVKKIFNNAKAKGQLQVEPTVGLFGQQTSIDGQFVILFPLTSDKGLFMGRRADIEKNLETGLEFSEIDLLLSPLHAMVRLTDNMDIRINRFSDIQRHPIFLKVLRKFGDTRTDEAKKLMGMEQALITGQISEDELLTYKEKLIDEVISESQIHSITPTFRGVLMKLDSNTYRHFGGCEAIQEINLTRTSLTIVVESTTFNDLNQIRFDEKNSDGILENIGIGEYQIWRLLNAYKSIHFAGQNIDIKILDNKGNRIPLSTVKTNSN